MSQSRRWIRFARFRRQSRLRLVLHPRLVETFPLAVALRPVNELERLVRRLYGHVELGGVIDVFRHGILFVLGCGRLELVLVTLILALFQLVLRFVLTIVFARRIVLERRIVIVLCRRSALVLLLLVFAVLLRVTTGLVLDVVMLLLVLHLTHALIVQLVLLLLLLLDVQLRRLYYRRLLLMLGR